MKEFGKAQVFFANQDQYGEITEDAIRDTENEAMVWNLGRKKKKDFFQR